MKFIYSTFYFSQLSILQGKLQIDYITSVNRIKNFGRLKTPFLDPDLCLYCKKYIAFCTCSPISNRSWTGGRIHERTTSVRFLGIIWRVLRLRFLCTMFTLQTSFKPLLLKGAGIKSVSRGDCEWQGGKLLKLLSPPTSKNSTSVIKCHCGTFLAF